MKNYPTLFQADSLFARFPYLLPNIVCTAVVIFGLVVGFLFLEETHEDKKDRRDVGLEMGQWLLRNLSWRRESPCEAGDLEEKSVTYLAEEEASASDADASCPLLPSSPSSASGSEALKNRESKTMKFSFRQAFTRQVTLIIISYGILAL